MEKAEQKYGEAGFGDYYQLKAYTGESVPAYLKVDDELLVIFLKDGSSKYAVLEYRD